MEFPLEDGGFVIIEVPEGLPAEGPVTRGWGDGGRGVLDRAGRSLEDSLAGVRPAVQALIGQLHSLSQVPDEVHVEFGLQLSAEMGAFVAGASTAANFKVSMTWRGQPDQPPGTRRGHDSDTPGSQSNV